MFLCQLPNELCMANLFWLHKGYSAKLTFVPMELCTPPSQSCHLYPQALPSLPPHSHISCSLIHAEHRGLENDTINNKTLQIDILILSNSLQARKVYYTN